MVVPEPGGLGDHTKLVGLPDNMASFMDPVLSPKHLTGITSSIAIDIPVEACTNAVLVLLLVQPLLSVTVTV
jgi:hypothetical protein